MGVSTEQQAIVLDLGQCNIRIGFADASKWKPDHFIKTETLAGGCERTCHSYPPVKNDTDGCYLASRCTSCRLLSVDTFDHLCRSYLGIEGIQEHPVLLVESALLERRCRAAKLEVFFEEIHSQTFAIVNEGLMSLYSCGRHTGVVVHSGYSESYCLAIHEGIWPSYAVVPMHPYSGYELVKLTKGIMKQSCCGSVGVDPTLSEAMSFMEIHGRVAPVRNGPVADAGPQIGEYLFGSSEKKSGIHTAVERVIYEADEDKDYNHFYYENVVLSGGNTKLPGLPERLRAELEKTKVDKDAKVSVIATPYREHGPWIGGSIAASLPTFKHHWISRQDYEEFGVNILRRKCLR